MEESGKNIRWYVMHVMSGHELRVLESLCTDCMADSANLVDEAATLDLFLETFHAEFKGQFKGIYALHIPYTVNVVKVEPRVTKSGVAKNTKKTKEVKRKLYPGYIMLRAELFDDSDKVIAENLNYLQSTKDVIEVIKAQRPQPLSDVEVERMMHNQSEAAVEVKPVIAYKVGESVSIKDGSFGGCEGIIESIDPLRQKLTVSVVIFGRHTPVEMDCGQVERL